MHQVGLTNHFILRMHGHTNIKSYRRIECTIFKQSQKPEPEYYSNLYLNRLTPNDQYMGRTAPLTYKCCILYIYSRNIGTEYFKNVLYSPFFSSSKCSLFHNANLFGFSIIHILYTVCAEIKKK